MARIDLTALRTLAEAATSGPWKLEVHKWPGGEWLVAEVRGQEAEARYIAALSPATVLRLLDALEAVLTVCDAPLTGERPGDPRRFGYNAALEDVQRIITTTLGADHD